MKNKVKGNYIPRVQDIPQEFNGHYLVRRDDGSLWIYIDKTTGEVRKLTLKDKLKLLFY